MRRALAVALMLAGALALADAALTLAWQEPVSALRARGEQPRLRAELRALELRMPAPTSAQRRAAVAAGARTAEQVVEVVYADVDRVLWPAAKMSVLAQLAYLGVAEQPG
jgi:hypothetical protein